MSRTYRFIGAAALCFGLPQLAAAGNETRYHGYCKKAKGSGNTVRPAAATYFGGPGVEELIGAGFAPDGTVIAVGNAWGSDFPAAPGVRVLGEDRPSSASPYRDGGKKLDEDHPGIAGFAVRFSPDLKSLLGGVRFGFGVATATHFMIAPDGSVYLSGTCGEALRSYVAEAVKRNAVRTPPEGVRSGGKDLYLARVPASGGPPDWMLVFEQAEDASAAWERRVGRRAGIHAALRSPGELAFVAYDRIFAVSTDGTDLREVAPTGGGILWAADPRDGSTYVGGDENTRTGREPWRRPFLRKFDRDGALAWEIWRWDSKLVGTDRYRLVSDSSVRHIVPLPEGELVVAGWSDGGNSVFNRQPKDLDATASYAQGFIDSLWGAGVGTFMRVMRIDGSTPAFKAGTVWCSFQTSRNKPNSLGIDDLAVLEDGRVAVVGRSAWALVESPDAWVRRFPEGTSGAYFALFSADLGELLFSSVLPTLGRRLSIAVKGTKAIVAAAAEEPKAGEGLPLQAGWQSSPAGEPDGYLLLVETAAKEGR